MTEEKMPALPEPSGFLELRYGGVRAWDAGAMRAFRAEGEADLRARLAAEIQENLAHHRLHDRHGERVIALEAEVVRLRTQRDEAVAALTELADCTAAGIQEEQAAFDLPPEPVSQWDYEAGMAVAKARATLASLKEQAA